MSQQVITELVIDADTSGADQFSQSMDRASMSAQSGMSSVASMSLAIAGVGVAVIGAVAGLRAFIDYAGQQSQLLVDIAEHAELAGMSTREFQQTLFAARSQGITDKDFVAGLDKISADLEQAGMGVTQFGKLFEANGVAIKNQNGQLISTKEALTDIMSLMQNAAPAVQRQVAAIVGVSASWIPFLKEGADQFEAQKKAAEDLGVIIDQSTIDKARDFNAQWKTAVATWDLQFKTSLASILPLLTQMATMASSILSGIGAATGAVGRWTTPDEDKTKAQLNDQINDAYRLREALEHLDQMDQNSLRGQVAGVQTRNLAGLLGLPENASIADVDKLLDKLSALYDKERTQVRITQPSGSTVLPNTPGPKDEIERATDAVEKQIARFQADAEAAGQGAGELERLRVENALYTAAQRAGQTDLERYANTFGDLADRAGKAAEALAKAKVAADIKFGQNTAFLSQDDAAIAGKLKDIYPDVTTALNSAEAAQLRFNNTARNLSSTIENDLVGGLTDIATQQKSISQGALDMGNAVVKAIEQMIIKIAIVQPLMQALQSTISGSGLGLGSLLGIGGGPASATAGLDGIAAIHHGGGVVGDPTMPSRVVNIADFASARRMHGGGIVGDEVPIIAKRGEVVGWPGQLAQAYGTTAPQVTVNMIEDSSRAGQTQQKSNDNGGLDITVFVDSITAKNAANPGSATSRVLDQRGRLAAR